MKHLSITPNRRTVDRAGPSLDLPSLVGDEGWRRLPAAVRRRFGPAHRDAVYEGELTLHCSPIGRLFAWASGWLGGPLTDERGDVPARVRVYGNGLGGVVWERHFAIAGRDKLVRSTKMADDHGRLVERTDGGLSMALDVFEDDGALVFQSRSYFFALAGRRLPIPGMFTPGTCRVEHHDLGNGRFRFVLSMVHPWWGTTFRQSGEFTDPEGSDA
ncbi:DUF4166 domain-containing protein [Variovorax sp. Sphag1AA]|uniref:DUF4166 domain-containing protein n=1 Tax=Variovorax sp. Sphag1AA TaxID=2587027 RepID=UPI00160EA365|nr:DUF4166 domain-containing protein [Variovorax sp. Sphag1AA]MBB3178030.1 hypothetical protein [Variovorax sp. Sphag1AA]